MLQTCSRIIALAAMVAGPSMTVQAAEPATLTLACKGTVTDMSTPNAKPEPLSMGIIVNFTAGTVQGLDFMTRSIQGLIGPKDFVKITSTNDLTITFLGRSSSGLSINGSLNRVTGELEATYMTSSGEWPQSTITTQTLALKCRPTQRMF